MTQQAHRKTFILIRLTFAMHGYQDESNPIKADKPLSMLLGYQGPLIISLVRSVVERFTHHNVELIILKKDLENCF